MYALPRSPDLPAHLRLTATGALQPPVAFFPSYTPLFRSSSSWFVIFMTSLPTLREKMNLGPISSTLFMTEGAFLSEEISQKFMLVDLLGDISKTNYFCFAVALEALYLFHLSSFWLGLPSKWFTFTYRSTK